MIYEVILRYIFDSPTRWALETSQFINLTIFILAGGYALYHGSHVRVDFIRRRFGVRAGPIVDIILYVFIMLLFIGIMVWQGIDAAAWSWGANEHTGSLWGPPVYYVKSLIPLGALLLGLQTIVTIVNSIRQIGKREEGELHN